MTEDVSARRAREFVQQAIDIATDVPEPFRVAVFSKVFDFFVTESRPSTSQNSKNPGGATAASATVHDVRSRKPRSSTGAKGVASDLIEAGFFDRARTVDAVAEHIKLNLARNFASKDLSKGLIRLVRDGRLRREKSEEGKLGYRKI
jgi:hypothetical protein